MVIWISYRSTKIKFKIDPTPRKPAIGNKRGFHVVWKRYRIEGGGEEIQEDKKSIEIDTGTIKRFKRVEFLPVSIEAASLLETTHRETLERRCVPFLSACAESDKTSRRIRVHEPPQPLPLLRFSVEKERNVEIGTVLVEISPLERNSIVLCTGTHVLTPSPYTRHV